MGQKTILIADDFEGIILKLKSLLEKAGFRVIYCENGKDAYEIISEQTIDLVITDVEMPGMNGIELIRSVRKLDTYTNTPLLVVTKDASYKQRSKAAGATGWITKPYNAPKVLELIEALI